eukprot:4527065-Pyramimonas_sp.AAC.1
MVFRPWTQVDTATRLRRPAAPSAARPRLWQTTKANALTLLSWRRPRWRFGVETPTSPASWLTTLAAF